MKLEFSLATLLVCMTVLAVVAAIAALMPVRESRVSGMRVILPQNGATGVMFNDEGVFNRPPTGEDIVARNTIFAPPAIAAPLGVLWAIRRLKSRRENVPAVG